MLSLVCNSMPMREVAKRIERAAEADSPVLIWGEAGTGKKLVARTIHGQSRRSPGPLVVVSTQVSRNQSIEDLLFGTAGRRGRLAAAHQGTLLIDGIEGLSRTGQARLLNATEGRGFRDGIGADGNPIDFRLMATARNELAQSVKRGAVREDLSYRLAVVTIHVPPLRDRPEDIPALVRQMLHAWGALHQRPAPTVEPRLMQEMVDRSWPGNVAELRDCLNAMLQDHDLETLELADLYRASPDEHGGGLASGNGIDTLAHLERAAVIRALEAHRGNRTQAARTLGISVRTLQRKLKYWNT